MTISQKKITAISSSNGGFHSNSIQKLTKEEEIRKLNNNKGNSVTEPNNFSSHLDEIIHDGMQKEASESDDD